MASEFTTQSEFTTPESHPNYRMRISAEAKRSARETDPNGGRCLVQNSAMIVDFCHLVSRNNMEKDEIVCVYRNHQ